MLAGSGVNLTHFSYQPFPEGDEVGFLFISRIMKEKGIEEYLDAAEAVRAGHPEAHFRILGFMEEDYTGRERFAALQKSGVIEFLGSVEDVIPYIRQSQCIVHPSYYPEGMSNVCQEAAACGRNSACRRVKDMNSAWHFMLSKTQLFRRLPWDMPSKAERFT